ncbi:GNAT family N-acetyltransferase [Actinotalea sp. BY-33]|uniref:GNAT family N-acetyltransferase n=1 Tax=Actinotalea soli TaxID=2819234 RepID=A0A939RT20_9CELL|nr:GNAT family N-acetyltransferase [Actinotalea soli]MBO1753202.1 GNAT family N-acetyltransferase [Actinotalea soli]
MRAESVSPSASASELDDLMRQGWPSLETVDVDGWLVRRSHGVTRRANSTFPRTAPQDLPAALDQVEAHYRAAGLATCFHISEAAQPPSLDGVLAARGYTLEAPTLVMTAPTGALLSGATHAPHDVQTAEAPDGAWTDLWWAVDGRGDAQAREVALRIIRSGPALYASVAGPHGALAVGRLALAGSWAGLSCLAVDPASRDAGLGSAVVHALARAGQARGTSALWLQVVETNTAARRLYERHGFRAAGRYHYRTRPAPTEVDGP